MKTKCPSCGHGNSEGARFCSECGAKLEIEHQQTITPPRETEAEDAPGAGFGNGCGCGFFLVFIGLALSLTGIGALIGIPMAIIGILMPFMWANSWAKGECPYCGEQISDDVKDKKGFDCPACKKRIIIRDKKFITID